MNELFAKIDLCLKEDLVQLVGVIVRVECLAIFKLLF